MKANITLAFFLFFTSFGCCIKKEFKSELDKFKLAVDVLTNNRALFIKYNFNKSNDDDFMFLAGKKEMQEIINREKLKELNAVALLWESGLIYKGPSSLWLLKNGDIYFQINKCKRRSYYLVFDYQNDIEIDVSDDNVKHRIEENWIYIEMKK